MKRVRASVWPIFLVWVMILVLVTGCSDSDPLSPQNSPPTVQITAPDNGATYIEGEDITFAGSGNDIEDGSLTGNSLVWTSDKDGQIGTSAGVTTSSLSVNTHTVTLTATDSDNATGTASIQITVLPSGGNQPPTVEITQPAWGTHFTVGDDVTFVGSAVDPEDGTLGGSNLVWISNRDGKIGEGQTITVNSLSICHSTIYLTATDSQGASGTDSVLVKIDANQPPSVTITSPNEGDTFGAGAVVSFTSTVVDVEDTTLPPGALVWRSSLDGQIGTGLSVSTSLSVGLHTITLTATDSHGDTGADQIQVTVQANAGLITRAGAIAPPRNRTQPRTPRRIP
jgi:hypothetical protein